MKVRFNGADYELEFLKYDNGRTALQLAGPADREPAATATVNLAEQSLLPHRRAGVSAKSGEQTDLGDLNPKK